MLFKLSQALSAADQNPLFRPLYEISEAGVTSDASVQTPHWMMIRPSPENSKNNEIDFRDELNISKHHPEGLKMDILVSDTTKNTNESGWEMIGQIDLHESVVSYGCDRQLHFHHPKIKP
jgi:hypothetical protein